MLPIVETIIGYITPVLTIIRNLINVLPWEPEINYIIASGVGGYFIGKSSEYLSPLKIGLIVGALIFVVLMFM